MKGGVVRPEVWRLSASGPSDEHQTAGEGRLAEKAMRATCVSAARRTPDLTNDLEMWHPSIVVAQLDLAFRVRWCNIINRYYYHPEIRTVAALFPEPH